MRIGFYPDYVLRMRVHLSRAFPAGMITMDNAVLHSCNWIIQTQRHHLSEMFWTQAACSGLIYCKITSVSDLKRFSDDASPSPRLREHCRRGGRKEKGVRAGGWGTVLWLWHGDRTQELSSCGYLHKNCTRWSQLKCWQRWCTWAPGSTPYWGANGGG